MEAFLMQLALNNSLHVPSIQKYSSMIYGRFPASSSITKKVQIVKKKIPTCFIAKLEVVEVDLANDSCPLSAHRTRPAGTSIPFI